jgi:hypothetical protein
MPITYSEAENKIIDLLQRYSGRKDIRADQMVNHDLGIGDWEGIDILQDIEEAFDMDLDPLMQSVTLYLPLTWWDRLLRRTRGARVTDLKVQDLISYVAEHAGEGLDESIPRV